MTLEDLKTVQSDLWDVRSKWYNLGIQLDMKIEDLEAIKEKNSNNPDQCFTDCITCWLRRSDPLPTWVALLKALKEHTVGFQTLAQDVERKHMHSYQKIKHDKVSFPHISEVAVDEQQREELEQRLVVETKDIKYKFYILINKFFDTLEDQNSSVERLVRYLEKPLSKEFIPQPTKIKEVQSIVGENSSFYDYQLLEYMIELAGTENDKKELEKYKESFLDYAQRRVFECPCQLGATRTQNDTELHVKLDSSYKCKLAELREFQIRLCHILKVKVYITRLLSVEKGCLELCFLLPQHVQVAIFPLSVEQEMELVGLGVLQLSSGDYKFKKPIFQVCTLLTSKVLYM